MAASGPCEDAPERGEERHRPKAPTARPRYRATEAAPGWGSWQFAVGSSQLRDEPVPNCELPTANCQLLDAGLRNAVAPRAPPSSAATTGVSCMREVSPVERVWTTELGGRAGERVRLCGWLHQLRALGKVSFLVLRDGKGLAQVVIDEPALVEAVAGLQNESVLQVEGVAVPEPRAPGGVE